MTLHDCSRCCVDPFHECRLVLIPSGFIFIYFFSVTDAISVCFSFFFYSLCINDLLSFLSYELFYGYVLLFGLFLVISSLDEATDDGLELGFSFEQRLRST